MNQSEFEANTYDRSQAPNACEQGTIGFGTFDKQSRNFAIPNNISLE